jgi:hypothetical protein
MPVKTVVLLLLKATKAAEVAMRCFCPCARICCKDFKKWANIRHLECSQNAVGLQE